MLQAEQRPLEVFEIIISEPTALSIERFGTIAPSTTMEEKFRLQLIFF